MLFSASSIRNFTLFTAAALQIGCAAPLGPGFSHPTRAIEAASPSAAPAAVRLSVSDKLRNTGNRDLDHLDFDLPPAVDPIGLKVSVNGREVRASRASSDSDAPWRIHFDHGFNRGETLIIGLSYDLQPESSDRGLIASSPDGTCIADRSAFPVWRAPAGIFVNADAFAHARTVAFNVPDGFRVLAAGRRVRAVRKGSATQYEFRAVALEAPPYFVAGRYQEQRVKTRNGEVIFWTFQPLDGGAARAAAERLAATRAIFQHFFGPLRTDSQPFYVVESPAATSSAVAGGHVYAASFPEGVLLDHSAFAQGIGTEPVLEAAEDALARIWFGWYGEPSQQARIVFGQGMGLFAVALDAEARGGADARRLEVARLLAAYNSAHSRAPDNSLLNVPASATPEQQSAVAYRAALFWAALEDQAGSETFAAAVRRYWIGMKGQPMDIPELRSALEAASGRDFAAAFRSWLDRPGIPDDFRARYSAQP